MAQADEKRADCLLFIDGQSLIDGDCMFSMIDDTGSFTITALNGRTFAYVLVSEPGVADGYWNGGNYAGHAHDALGILYRNEACWANDRASVCAW